MAERKSPYAPDRVVCAYCRGTGWANQRDVWDDDVQRTAIQRIPGVVPCLCTQGHHRQDAYQKSVEHNCENLRKGLGNNWRDEYKVSMAAEIERLNPKAEREQEPLPF